MKIFYFICILFFVFSVSVSAQETVKSKYGGVYNVSVANEASWLKNKTVLEARDYGIDLFISGMVLNVLSPSIIIPVTTIASVGSGSASGAAAGTLIGVGVSGALSTAGFGMWVAGAVYWARGNNALNSNGVVLFDAAEEDGPTVAFDGSVVTLSY